MGVDSYYTPLNVPSMPGRQGGGAGHSVMFIGEITSASLGNATLLEGGARAWFPSNDSYLHFTDSVGTEIFGTSNSVIAIGLHRPTIAVMGDMDRQDARLYSNGRLISTVSSGLDGFSSNAPISFGGSSNFPNADYVNGSLNAMVMWSGMLTDIEARSLLANPNQIFLADRRYFFVGASGGAVSLVGLASSQVNGSASGAISANHILIAATSAQANVSGTGALGGSIVLAGSTCSQANLATVGVVAVGRVLAAAATTQANASLSAAIAQRHSLSGVATNQANSCSTGSLSGGVVLAGSTCSQSNASSVGASAVRHVLVAVPSVQDNIAASSWLVQRHLLAAAACAQANLAKSGGLVPNGGIDAQPLIVTRSRRDMLVARASRKFEVSL